MSQPLTKRGFTLLELSIVLLIMAILSGIGLVATMGAIESAKRVATEKKLDEIEKALMNFRLMHNRVPCPGDLTLAASHVNYGLEGSQIFPITSLAVLNATGAQNCLTGSVSANYTYYFPGKPFQIAAGSIPVRTLNLPDDYMYDGWGRKFTYAVDAYTTIPNAFKVMRPEELCSLIIKDGSDSARTTGAVYALISHGPNGHGAFLPNGTRQNAGSTNTDEHTNCHCDATGASTGSAIGGGGTYYIYDRNPLTNAIYTDGLRFVQKDATGDLGSPDSFDDIVRYKTRMQLQNYDDQYNYAYKGPQGVAVKDANGFHGIQAFGSQCGYTKISSQLNGDTSPYSNAAFMPANTHIFTYTPAGGGTCRLYKVNGTTTTSLGNNDTIMTAGTCPVNAITAKPPLIAVAENGIMVMTDTAPPYLKSWIFSDNFLYRFTRTGVNALSVMPAATPTTLSMTANGKYLALSDGSTSGVYLLNKDNVYAPLTPPVGMKSDPGGLALSPDGRYLAVEDAVVSGKMTVKLWHMLPDNSFVAIDPVITLEDSNPLTAITFSPDTKYLAIGTETSLRIYSIEAGDAFTLNNLMWYGAVGGGVDAMGFGRNADYLMMMPSSSGKVYFVNRYEPDKWGVYPVYQGELESLAGTGLAVAH